MKAVFLFLVIVLSGCVSTYTYQKSQTIEDKFELTKNYLLNGQYEQAYYEYDYYLTQGDINRIDIEELKKSRGLI